MRRRKAALRRDGVVVVVSAVVRDDFDEDSSGGAKSVHPSALLTVVFQNLFRCREVGEFVSGALAGAMTKAVLDPLQTIRTRMLIGVGSRHITGSFMEIIEQQGLPGLWAGNTVNMLRIIPTQAIELGTFEFVKRTMTSMQEKCKEEEHPKMHIGNFNIDISFSCLSDSCRWRGGWNYEQSSCQFGKLHATEMMLFNSISGTPMTPMMNPSSFAACVILILVILVILR